MNAFPNKFGKDLCLFFPRKSFNDKWGPEIVAFDLLEIAKLEFPASLTVYISPGTTKNCSSAISVKPQFFILFWIIVRVDGNFQYTFSFDVERQPHKSRKSSHSFTTMWIKLFWQYVNIMELLKNLYRHTNRHIPIWNQV